MCVTSRVIDVPRLRSYHTTDMATAEKMEMEIMERDEAGNVTARYIASGGSRVDVIVRAASILTSSCDVGYHYDICMHGF
jgi:hypothetical protein